MREASNWQPSFNQEVKVLGPGIIAFLFYYQPKAASSLTALICHIALYSLHSHWNLSSLPSTRPAEL